MAKGAEDREVCAVCGCDERTAGHWFCHFYPQGRPLPLCSPGCAEVYLARPGELSLLGGSEAPAWHDAPAVGRAFSTAPSGTAFPM